MLTSITDLNVSECTLLTDRGLGGIATRCEKLRSFLGTGLPALTAQGFRDFACEPVARQPRGENLRVLDFSFVSTLDDAGLDILCR